MLSADRFVAFQILLLPFLDVGEERLQRGATRRRELFQSDFLETLVAQALDFAGIARLLEAAVTRSVSGPASGPVDPDLDELVALDLEIRAAFATGPTGGVA